jgi:hypothetical protein
MRAALLACIAVLATAAAVPAATHAQARPGFQRGFVLTARGAGTYLTPASDSELWSMADGGSDHAAIFTQWFMDTPASSRLAPDPARTPTDAAILHAAATARRLGMEVTLKPQIGIRTGSWIGSARPADATAFWASYRTMLLHYADLARQAGATTLVIGTEMRTLSADEARWRPLIAAARERFHGRLTYAANYDEFQRVPFWDALDYIGIDAYFALASPGDPAPATDRLAAAWRDRGYLAAIAATSARTGKRVLFTEIGYRGAHAAATRPGDWRARDTPDTRVQASAYQAFYDAVASQPWMAGVYWWEVNPDEWWIQDYNPLGKPAGAVVEAWNRGTGP